MTTKRTKEVSVEDFFAELSSMMDGSALALMSEWNLTTETDTLEEQIQKHTNILTDVLNRTNK